MYISFCTICEALDCGVLYQFVLYCWVFLLLCPPRACSKDEQHLWNTMRDSRCLKLKPQRESWKSKRPGPRTEQLLMARTQRSMLWIKLKTRLQSVLIVHTSNSLRRISSNMKIAIQARTTATRTEHLPRSRRCNCVFKVHQSVYLRGPEGAWRGLTIQMLLNS